MSEDDRGDELLRQFEAVISGGGLDELRGRPDLRRPRLDELKLFRVRVDLRQSTPPIWRRLEVRSDLTLDVLHKVLQAVFDWQDYHLWRFSLGGEPFDRTSQLLLCQWDLDEGEEEDDGIGAAEVRLDEVLQDPGDLLSYVYDYGDHWELTIVLEDVSPAPSDAVSAVVVDGRRAAPPEDCGGLRDAESLAEVLGNPARFDLDEINAALRKPFFALTEAGIDPRLVNLIDRLAHSPFGDRIIARALTLLDARQAPGAEEIRESFGAFTWFLDRAAEAPIQLTASGYLKPADVQALAPLVPMMGDWVGKANREADTRPVLYFRELVCELGLLRKYKGTLRLTKAGAKVHRKPAALWDFIADRLSPTDEGFDEPANLLALFFAATSPDGELPIDEVAGALNYLGWRVNGTRDIEPYDLYWMAVLGVLRNVAERPVVWKDRWRISPAAARLARAVLQTG